MHQDHKRRWVFGPIIDGVHAAGEYSLSCEWPVNFNGVGLAFCVMNAHQLRAARQDARLVVLHSLHSSQPVPERVTTALSAYGAKHGATLHDLLCELSAHHHNFEPEY